MRTTKPAAATLAALTGILLATGCVPETPAGDSGSPDHAGLFDGTAGEWIDLSHSFGPSTIYWPTDTLGFQLNELAYGHTEAGYFYASYSFASAEHGGTHADAPIHFAEGRMAAHEIPLSRLITTASVVDVSAGADADPDYLLSVDDLTAWEAEHGPIADGTALLIRTGWSSRWNDRTAYLGTDLTGPEAVPELHFPGIGPEAAQWLVDNRNIGAIGLDTPSIDYGQSTDFQSHVILYAENIVGFENLTNLDRLPPTGAGIVALPMKIEGGSGGPLRIVGWVPG
ncbi:MAG: cyclase family protein [Gemmatimonadetes bacterium]|nr:cyclase family protein [Gemmatimonadota bacterium]